jgi:uncharacterized protein YraI
MLRHLALAAGTAGLLVTAATAQTTATATTDLNLRAEPSPMAEIIGVIPASGSVTVEGCADTVNWCRVNHAGTVGWAFGDYLTTTIGSQPQNLYDYREQAQVHHIEVKDTTFGSTVGGGITGAIVGGLVGGPVGAAAGAAIGGAAGAATDPGPQVTSYVVENPVDPVYLQGEVVEGAGLPETVTLYPVPDSDLRYVYVNGVPVLVDDDRRIVTVIR